MGKPTGLTTAYGIYVHEWIAKMKKEGKKAPVYTQAFSDPEISETWRALDENIKAQYKLRAKANKGQPVSLQNSIADSRPSTSASAYQDSEPSTSSFVADGHGRPDSSASMVTCSSRTSNYDAVDNPIERIAKTISKMSRSAVAAKKFYFMATNIKVKTSSGYYHPLEIGLVEYSIAKGTINKLNIFVDSGNVPLGYAADALEHAATHKIPLYDFASARDDYQQILKEIKDFVAPGSEFDGSYLIICDNKFIATPQNQGSLEFLADKCDPNTDEGNELKTFVESILFMNTVKFALSVGKAGGLNFDDSTAYDKMTLTCYDYYPHTNCDYHDNLPDDNMYCALGNARKWTYLVTDAVCDAFGVEVSTDHKPPPPSLNLQPVMPEPSRRAFRNSGQTDGRYSSLNSTFSSSRPTTVQSFMGDISSQFSDINLTDTGSNSRASIGNRTVSSRATNDARPITPNMGMGRGMRPPSRFNRE